MAFKEIYQAFSDNRDINTTIFKKEFTDSPPHMQELNSLIKDTNRAVNKELVEQHLHLFKLGLIGESNVAYELKNSMLPMVCLHDIQLEHEGYTAQFDFIVVTHSVIFIIETKKLFGDIEVNKEGNFIRKIKNKIWKSSQKRRNV
ncbi:MAG: NERD domain-containing protein [Bacillus sp. (in: Bacteria)]|nr:NERD domain-containing protein [Bacillus sp. (in: firmicutes)]